MITEKEAAKKTPKHIQMSISLSVCKAWNQAAMAAQTHEKSDPHRPARDK